LHRDGITAEKKTMFRFILLGLFWKILACLSYVEKIKECLIDHTVDCVSIYMYPAHPHIR
jgi:hypothetical protein